MSACEYKFFLYPAFSSGLDTGLISVLSINVYTQILQTQASVLSSVTIMKLTTFLPALAFVASATAASDYENAMKCGKKNPEINSAIEQFCRKGNMIVPSKYAGEGHTYGGIHVAIHGTCEPQQWVPPEYCNLQFHEICAHHKHGAGFKRYNGCQDFRIERVKYE